MAECCADLFDGFKFREIRDAKPPRKKGVYIIRISRRGDPVDDIVRQCRAIARGIRWHIVEEWGMGRVHRLDRITTCPVIYIGRSGKLRDRYKQFSSGHPAMFPLWALLYVGWGLDYGWIETRNPKELETSLKKRYCQGHDDRLPALVDT